MSLDSSGCFNATKTENFTNNHQQKDFHQDNNDFNYFFKSNFKFNLPNQVPYFVENEILNDFYKINDEVKKYFSKPSMSHTSNNNKNESSTRQKNNQQENHINVNKHDESDDYLQNIWSTMDFSEKKAAVSLMNENEIIRNSETPFEKNIKNSISKSETSSINFPRPITKSFKQKYFEPGSIN
jgi:hypothetical protein